MNYIRNVPRAAERTCGSVPTRAAAFFLSAILATVSTYGCTSAPAPAPATPTTLNIGIALPPSGGVPGMGVEGFISAYLIDEPLLGIGWDGRPAPKLFSQWSWEEDHKSLLIRLHDNLKFHDGMPADLALAQKSLTATFAGARDRQSAVSYRSVTGVDIAGEGMLRINLSRPEAFLVTDLANSTLSHPTDPDIGLGPYKLVTRKPEVELTAFDSYYRNRPSIDSIFVKDFEEQRSSWAALMRGQLDVVHEISPEAIDFIQAEGQTGVRTFSFTRPYFVFLFFNSKNPILKNVLVRQALSYAVDRQAVIAQGLNGQGTIAEGPIWPYHWAYSTAHKTYTRNIEAATLRLDSAGLRLKPASKPGEMPRRFSFRCLTVKDSRFEKMALVLQKQLFEIGVDMIVESMPMQQLGPRIGAGDYDAVLIERTSGRSLAWSYLTFHSSMKLLNYSAADAVLDRLRTAFDDGAIRTGVSDFQQVLHDDPPAIFIAWPTVARVVNARVIVPEEKGRDVLSSLWQWKTAPVQGK